VLEADVVPVVPVVLVVPALDGVPVLAVVPVVPFQPGSPPVPVHAQATPPPPARHRTLVATATALRCFLVIEASFGWCRVDRAPAPELTVGGLRSS
jgi:hypothetical protein